MKYKKKSQWKSKTHVGVVKPMSGWWICSYLPGKYLLSFPSQVLSQADMQAMGGTITMVTQEGTTITIPAHEAMLSSGGAHSVTMVSADGTEGQVAGVTSWFST